MFNRHKSLLRRVAKLERLIYEKSVGRGGEPSNAMKVWQLLTNNGPMTRQQIQSSGLSATATAGASLNFYVDHDLLTKNGNLFAANPDYAWDDIGVIPRTAQQELMNSIRNAQDLPDSSAIEEPQTRRRNTNREPRQPRTREVKQNLFSRKYEEVKAAIDAGQDCTAANEKGVTPIMYACRDPKGDSGAIVELLINNGANVDDYDGNKKIIFNAIKHSNHSAVKALVDHGADLTFSFKGMQPLAYALQELEYNDAGIQTLLLLATPVCYDGMYNYLIDAASRGLPRDTYAELINKIYDSSDKLRYMYSGSIYRNELSVGLSALYDRFIEITGTMPPLDYYDARSLSGNTYAYNKLYDTIRDVANGKIKYYSAYKYSQVAFIVCKALNKPCNFIYSFITPEFVVDACNNTTRGKDDIQHIISDAIQLKLVGTLNVIAKSKVNSLDSSVIVRNVLEYGKNDRSVTVAALKVASNCIKSFGGRYILRDVSECSNEYVIDWVIDKGFGQSLVDYMGTYASDYCKKALTEAGFDIENKTPPDVRNAKAEYNDAKDYILRQISNDTWSTTANSYIDKYPQLLRDSDINDAVNSNLSGNITARQLKRRIDALPKEDPDKYDF